MADRAGSNRILGTANPLDVTILDGAGNSITSFGGGSGGTAHTDDAAFSIGSAASTTPAGFLADETAPDSVDEGDIGVARMTLSRKQLMVLSDADSNTHADVLDLASSNPLAVAIVDAAGDQIASFGGGTQYTEDAAAAANPVGTALILVRADTPGATVTTDGDNIAQRGTDYGAAYVTIIDGIGALATPLTNTQLRATPVPVADASMLSELETTNSLLGLTGALVQITDATGFIAGITDEALDINVKSGSVTVIQATGTNLHTVVDSGTLTAVTAITNALPAGTNAIGKLAANSGVDIGDVDVTSITDAVAHDAADANNGIKIAAKAIASSLAQTLVAANDRTNIFADLDGALLSRSVTLADLASERVSNTDGASTACTGQFAAVASQRNYITSVTVHNTHATTNGYVDLRDGTAGGIMWTFPLPATGGTTHNFNPPLRQPTTNTALAFDVSAAITTVYLSFNGFKSKL